MPELNKPEFPLPEFHPPKPILLSPVQPDADVVVAGVRQADVAIAGVAEADIEAAAVPEAEVPTNTIGVLGIACAHPPHDSQIDFLVAVCV